MRNSRAECLQSTSKISAGFGATLVASSYKQRGPRGALRLVYHLLYYVHRRSRASPVLLRVPCIKHLQTAAGFLRLCHLRFSSSFRVFVSVLVFVSAYEHDRFAVVNLYHVASSSERILVQIRFFERFFSPSSLALLSHILKHFPQGVIFVIRGGQGLEVCLRLLRLSSGGRIGQ